MGDNINDASSDTGAGKGGFLSEIENIDLSNLYKEKVDAREPEKREYKYDVPEPEECLYDKSYECPCCNNKFKARAVRKNKARYIDTDIDLKSNCTPIQPDYYDIILCENCGYAALASNFDKLTDKQSELIAEGVTPKYVRKEYPFVYDAATAIERYKIALFNSIVKKAKSGEKAFLCLRIAWIYRDLKDKTNEISYLRSAYEGFLDAFTHEKFPLCGMDENTLMYLLSAICYELGEFQECKRTLGRLLVKRGLTPRLKTKAEDLREILREKQI